MRRAALTLLGIVFTFAFLAVITGCNYPALKGEQAVQSTEPAPVSPNLSTEIPPPDLPSLLTICLGQEPGSLFLYGDGSQAARSIRQAINDGPIDIRSYEPAPVILEKIPTLANGDVFFESVTVQPGSTLADSGGQLVKLSAGVSYLPAGCSDVSCAQTYSGQEPVQIDQQVVRFRLRPGLTWSDGATLSADDSQYSYEVARSLYPRARPDLVLRTQSYQALDETGVEWRGIPGHRYSGYITSFFTPLPRHAWSAISPQELLTADQSSRTPLGWGAYKIDEWTAGDHISLSRNPGYFRSGEGLPHFEHLVFRFISDPAEALAALEAGECDYLDETIRLQSLGAKIEEAQANGKLVSLRQPGTAWEHLDFGIAPLDLSLLPIFQAREARQAVALCTDRQKIAAELFPGQPVALDSYIPADHPLFNPDARRYSFDPGAANSLLESIGWSEEDGNAATPRRSQGVAGIPDGTPFEIRFLTSEEPEKVRVGEILRDSLAQCGITLNVSSLPDEQLFATGSEAPIFGRRFYLVQYAWMGAWQPPCYLYTTQEIPGPYPQYQKGWGGSNPSGYSSADFDRACSRALAIMPEQPEFQAAHFLAQSIFADDLPSLPLYLHTKQVAHRPELCGVSLESSTDSVLWNLESFVYGESCPQ